ncbi:MAG: hypothetical protein HOP09_09990 [Hyphomicrobium sp.]|nr:hypothetical protein [Hyphomicrobium sp.]
MSLLNEGSLVEAMMDARGQIDFLWQFFVTVHIAIFALLFIYDHAVEGFNWIAKIFSVAGIAAFEWINGNALANAYFLLDSMHEQYRWAFGQVDRFHASFYQHFVLQSYATRPEMVVYTHSTALAVILLAFVSRRFIQSKGESAALTTRLARGHDPHP